MSHMDKDEGREARSAKFFNDRQAYEDKMTTREEGTSIVVRQANGREERNSK